MCQSAMMFNSDFPETYWCCCSSTNDQETTFTYVDEEDELFR